MRVSFSLCLCKQILPGVGAGVPAVGFGVGGETVGLGEEGPTWRIHVSS
jgi:hypothetical protein